MKSKNMALNKLKLEKIRNNTFLTVTFLLNHRQKLKSYESIEYIYAEQKKKTSLQTFFYLQLTCKRKKN